MSSGRFGRTLDCWIGIQQVTADAVRLRYSHKDWSAPVAAELLCGDSGVGRQEHHGNLTGCFVFENLSPATRYQVKVSIGGQSAMLEFSTLPEPRTERLFRVAVFSDPHLSTQRAARNGRLHGESIALLRELLAEAARSADCIISAGDLTDSGTEAEFACLESILKKISVPVLAVPGNHDLVHGGEARFLRLFGAPAFFEERRGVQLAGVDTGDGFLGKPCNRAVFDRIDPGKPLMLFSHFQLFADEWIPDADKVIFDPGDCRAMLAKTASCRGIGCIGHKNVATQVKVNSFTQINLPQLTHFPAGYLVIDVHRDEFRLRFEPIPSEILNEYSRLGTEAARYHAHPACALKSEYRDRYTQSYWNGTVKNGLFV